MTGTLPTRRGYRIRVAGRLDDFWAAWFDGFTIVAGDDGTTTVSGRVADQAQLHGLFAKLRDLGVEIVSVDGDEISGWRRADGSGTGSRP